MTKPTVAVIAPGNMGAAVGARLSENGVTVLTSLAGRSAASAKRAAEAGMRDASESEIASADIVLSIVPPGDAQGLAERLQPALEASNHKPIYIDCNAVNPQTVKTIAAIIEATGTSFVDGGIIGPPPQLASRATKIYVSGAAADRVKVLNQYGLLIRSMDGAVGGASALKMSYAGLTKGLVALGAAMALAAQRAGVSEALYAELADSQGTMLAQLARGVPGMFPKAYRWVAELQEIGRFAGSDAEAEIYDGIARLYDRIAKDLEGSQIETAALERFYAAPGKAITGHEN